MNGLGNTGRTARFRALPVEVDALRVVLGVTSKDDILALCPSANVGVPVVGHGEDKRDLRWIFIDTGAGPVPAGHGDWIVSTPAGFEVLTDDRFRSRFCAVTDGEDVHDG